MSCDGVREILPAFLADEIPAGESRDVQEHLDRCAACRKFRDFELAFDKTVRRSLDREAAPPSLILGVQRALNGETIAELPAWRRWALAASILIAVLAPVTIGYELGYLHPSLTAFTEKKVLTGTLVCSACEREGVPVDHQRGCKLHGHRAAFRCDETGLWELVDGPGAQGLITAASRLGDRIEVSGRFLSDIHYVDVSSFRYLSDGRTAVEGL